MMAMAVSAVMLAVTSAMDGNGCHGRPPGRRRRPESGRFHLRSNSIENCDNVGVGQTLRPPINIIYLT